MEQAFTILQYYTQRQYEYTLRAIDGTSCTPFVRVAVILIKTVQGLVHVFSYGGSCWVRCGVT